ncbi:hypothetical protein CR164_04965 [Prosthecochloris marina]|uniref:Uncharacterized protein n=1 Tax=Prosthecochloris marina TaxID=2017681 RepID=A0A317T6W3_9CHLB|nr:hypothetical protein CR164_04965 [Prosthecochloris marina]
MRSIAGKSDLSRVFQAVEKPNYQEATRGYSLLKSIEYFDNLTAKTNVRDISGQALLRVRQNCKETLRLDCMLTNCSLGK